MSPENPSPRRSLRSPAGRLLSFHHLLPGSLALFLWAGCGEPLPEPPIVDTTPYVRVHYRIAGGGDARSWGLHFFGAGSKSPEWGNPARFDKSDAFGAYADIRVEKIADSEDAWLGLIPVQCSAGSCKKDVETSVRYVDLHRDAKTPTIAECWITQGQAVQIKPPTSTGPAYKISRPKDFIDLGDGRVRLMFRVASGSTGVVKYGSRADLLDQQVAWQNVDDINKNGLLLSGLRPGSPTYYQISTSYAGERDQSSVLSLTPISFVPLSGRADYATWGKKGIMYQLIVRTFADGGTPKSVADPTQESGIDPAQKDGIGDLIGLRQALPYLKDMGIAAIWMTPVFRAKSYHGYDTTDFFDIDPEVGSKKDFTDLTAAAHAAGIQIILDLVQNHVADVNPWFLAAINPKDPNHAKYRDWFVWSDEYSNMYTDKHPWDSGAVIWACKNYACYHQIFSTSMPELNFRNPEVRAEMKRIAQFWIGLGADGFRLDASKHIDQFDDNNGISLDRHGTHVWWQEFNHHVKKGIVRDPGAATVLLTGENRWDDPGLAKNMVAYGGDMDSQFDFPFRSVLSGFLSGKTGSDGDVVKYISDLSRLTADSKLGGNENHFYQRFLSNHDVDRPATQLAGQAGTQLDALLKQAATLVLTLPGMPVIYYGEEFGKRGKRDKYLGSEAWDHDEFIREPMSWYQQLSFRGDMKASWDIDPVASNAKNGVLGLPFGVCKAANPEYPFIKFMADGDTASFAAQKDQADSLFRHYKRLSEIRRSQPLLTDAEATLRVVEHTSDVYEYALEKAGQAIFVVLNRRPAPQLVSRMSMQTDLLTGTRADRFNIPPYGALVLQ